MTYKNTQTTFGTLTVKDPSLVYKAALVYDWYKRDKLPSLWAMAEKKSPLINPKDLFFQEEIKEGVLWYSFRYYTPKENIRG